MVYVPWLYYTNRNIFLCEGTRRFILVHISRRTHICTYIIFIYLYRYLSLSQTYTYQISCRSYKASMCTEVPLGTTEIRLVLRNLYLYYGAYSCSSDSYSCILDLILLLQSLYIRKYPQVLQRFYLYKSTCRYYRTDTEVPVGNIEIILVLWNLYWYCGTYSHISDLIVILQYSTEVC